MQELRLKLIENILNPSRLLSDTQKQVIMMETTKKTEVCVGSWEFFPFPLRHFWAKLHPQRPDFIKASSATPALPWWFPADPPGWGWRREGRRSSGGWAHRWSPADGGERGDAARWIWQHGSPFAALKCARLNANCSVGLTTANVMLALKTITTDYNLLLLFLTPVPDYCSYFIKSQINVTSWDTEGEFNNE